jgi:hypothetical protein
MESAIVLGQGEIWAYNCETEIGKHTSFIKTNSGRMNQVKQEEE